MFTKDKVTEIFCIAYASTCAICFLRWYPTTDGGARAEAKLVWIMPSRDRGRR